MLRDARCSARSCYVFHVGRVNEAKLGNFPEVLYSTPSPPAPPRRSHVT
jgi:hypothetical protein